MYESLIAEINVLSAKIEAEISRHVSSISTTTVSLNSSKNSAPSPVVPVSPTVLPKATPVEAASDETMLHTIIKDQREIFQSDQCYEAICN